MKITDINTQIGYVNINGKYDNCTTDKLIGTLDDYNVDSCVCFHNLSIVSTMAGNTLMSDFEKKNSRISACYLLRPQFDNPAMPSLSDLRDIIISQKPAAIKLKPKEDNYLLTPFYCGELLELLNQLHMPVFIDKTDCDFSNLPALVEKYSNVKFIIIRSGISDTNYITPLIKKTVNVYFETSVMIDFGYMDFFVNKFGSQKLLFGSGLPFYTPAGPLGMVLYGDFGQQDKSNILHDNWERIQGGRKL